MSETIRKYRSLAEGKDMYVHAYVGGEYGSCVQIGMGGKDYTCLSETQIIDLIFILSARVRCIGGFTATGETDLKIVEPDGELRDAED